MKSLIAERIGSLAIWRNLGSSSATLWRSAWSGRSTGSLHFTPTSASWLNMVERFFRDLTQNRLRRGVFRDLEELIMAIGTYIDRHNESPKPFIWTARAADILEKVKRARRTLNKRRSV